MKSTLDKPKHLKIQCTNCRNAIKYMGVASPTTSKKLRNLCRRCSILLDRDMWTKVAKQANQMQTDTVRMADKYDDACYDCGVNKYEEKRFGALSGIGIYTGKCPVCKKVKGIVPARDWAYRAGEFEKYI